MNTSTSQRGFSLIELMVSVSIFVIVMTISTGTLLALIDANRKARSMQAVINNVNFALDSMTRSLRTGFDYYCSSYSGVDNPAYTQEQKQTQDCSTGDEGITFTNQYGQPVGYRFDSTNKWIERYKSGEGWVTLTSPSVEIEGFSFYVTGANVLDDGSQPSVTINIRGKASDDSIIGEITDSTFNVQTTITQRRRGDQ